MEEIPCSLCKSSSTKSFAEATYHLNLLPPFEIKRCSACGFIFMSPRPDENERNALFAGSVPEILKPYSNETANYGAVTKGRLDFFRERITDILGQIGKAPNGLKFLDIGASSGYMVEAALESGIVAEGVEPGLSGITAAKQRGITLVHGTAEKLPYADNSFDIVHSHHVFEHVADPLLSAKEAYRVLKPGGFILIEVPNQFDNIRFWRDRIFKRIHQRKRDIRSIHHLSFFSKKSVTDLMIKSGFKSLHITTRYTIKPKGLQLIPGYFTMLLGLFYLGGERVIVTGKKINYDKRTN